MKGVKAVILVAGMGKRLSPVTTETPKCLVPVCGKPLLHNALSALEKYGTSEVVLVTGHLGDKVVTEIGHTYRGMKITYLDNKKYQETNNIYSLWLAKEIINEGCLLLECDTFFSHAIIKQFFETEGDDVIVVDKYGENMDGLCVIPEQGRVKEMVLTKDQGNNFDRSQSLKTLNIYRISATTGGKIARELEKKITQGELNIFYEVVFKELIEKEPLFHICNIHPSHWMEVDDFKDLKIAETMFQGSKEVKS